MIRLFRIKRRKTHINTGIVSVRNFPGQRKEGITQCPESKLVIIDHLDKTVPFVVSVGINFPLFKNSKCGNESN